MFFIIFKRKDKLTSYTNQLFSTEAEAADYAKRSLKRKDVWQVVRYDKENYDKYWFKI
nr:hypothetical protein [uncultured Mediterranean phage uvMED]BAR31600.1 hypothetical protein [uncultured Mediterranean phage uvMED]